MRPGYHLDLWAAHRWRVGIFLFAIITHYAMAATLALELVGAFPPGTASSTTPSAGLIGLLGVPGAAIGFFLAGAMAHAAMFINGRATWWLRILLLLWQQSVMIITSVQIIRFILVSEYADGYRAPWQFILSDQIDGSLILGFLHTLALFHFIGFILFKGTCQASNRAAH